MTTHIPDIVRFVSVCGPAGAGKTRLVEYILKEVRDPRFIEIRSITTRMPRNLLENKSDSYSFVSKENFDTLHKENRFAWEACVGGYKYGTFKSDLDRVRASSKHTGILVVTPDTVPTLKKYVEPHLVLPIFISTSKEIVIHRLINQDSLTEKEALERINRCAEYENKALYTGVKFAKIDNNNTMQEMVFQFYQALNFFFSEHV